MINHLDKNKLAKFKFPERLEIIEELPMIGSAKIDKKMLVEGIKEKLKKEGVIS
jgi:non-ribosomal peptide synthetase component E (peptide arylation enzyme)